MASDTQWFDDLDELADAVGGWMPPEAAAAAAKIVEGILKKHIQRDIYGVYRPRSGAWVYGTSYVRRNYLQDYVKSEILPGNVLFVTSTAPASPSIISGYSFNNEDSGLLQLIETGPWGIWKKGFPRPAVANAQKEVDNNHSVLSAYAKEMTREMNK